MYVFRDFAYNGKCRRANKPNIYGCARLCVYRVYRLTSDSRSIFDVFQTVVMTV